MRTQHPTNIASWSSFMRLVQSHGIGDTLEYRMVIPGPCADRTGEKVTCLLWQEAVPWIWESRRGAGGRPTQRLRARSGCHCNELDVPSRGRK